MNKIMDRRKIILLSLIAFSSPFAIAELLGVAGDPLHKAINNTFLDTEISKFLIFIIVYFGVSIITLGLLPLKLWKKLSVIVIFVCGGYFIMAATNILESCDAGRCL